VAVFGRRARAPPMPRLKTTKLDIKTQSQKVKQKRKSKAWHLSHALLSYSNLF
jgi:hypothetical protein